MAASQAELQRQLNTINARLAEIQAILNRSTRGTPRSRELTAEKKKLEEEKRKLDQELKNITTAQPTTSPPVNNRTTSKPNEAQLKAELANVNRRIAEIERELSSNPTPARRLNLERGLRVLRDTKTAVEKDLQNILSGGGGDFGGAGAGGSWDTAPVPPPPPPPPVSQTPTVTPNPTNTGIQGNVETTRKQETTQQNFNVEINNDWRVRLYLAPNSSYLYNDPNNLILSPLRNSNGVIFPYTPTINVTYSANYDTQDVMHSNYKLYFYKNSSVDNISIVCDFTAQDTIEANYLLAVIHFFKSVTKMFYGKDQNPTNGTPPPLVYIDGFGTYQFNKHPLLITNFTYALPNDVDYIRATTNPTVPSGVTKESENKALEGISVTEARLNGITPGGNNPPARWTRQESGVPTYVPTKMSITLNAIPVISRKDISDNFSLQGYANGSLLLGRDNKNIGAGIW